MSVKMKLEDLVEAMDVPDPEWHTFFNRNTGQFMTRTEDDFYVHGGGADEDLPVDPEDIEEL